MKEVEKEKKEKTKTKKSEEVKKTEKHIKPEKDKNKKEKTTKKTGFFKEVINELKKVKWPDKKYMVKYSISTFVIIIVLSVYFYLIYMLFTFVTGLING